MRRLLARIVNYVPNYAYEVWMTPETAGEVEELFFVDWVGFYHPAYKLQPGIRPGRVNVRMIPESGSESLKMLHSMGHVLEAVDLGERGRRLTVFARSEKVLHDIARMNDVYYIRGIQSLNCMRR